MHSFSVNLDQVPHTWYDFERDLAHPTDRSPPCRGSRQKRFAAK